MDTKRSQSRGIANPLSLLLMVQTSFAQDLPTTTTINAFIRHTRSIPLITETPTITPLPTSTPQLKTSILIAITLGATLCLLLLLLPLLIIFLRRRRRRKANLPPTQSNHELLHQSSDITLVTPTRPLPPRARTPLAIPFTGSHYKKASVSHTNSDKTGGTRGESVVDSLDWDWKRVYVYPFERHDGFRRGESRASSRLGSETVCTADGGR
ncbi:hypothetical protein QBC38DRAFT_487352 [Podospora fimiseda]|uniref:Uncharacterized protein n=1 Tax=Podospora fimiseda TaxID=252190 RepID=A0AAN7BHQ9_9PEZI|nr:hypothetical protein QBC38DRAFT_487352 [Podospora fimiseda]